MAMRMQEQRSVRVIVEAAARAFTGEAAPAAATCLTSWWRRDVWPRAEDRERANA